MSEPVFLEVIQKLIGDKLEGVNVSMPGLVTAFDASTQRASVQPLVRRVIYQPDGERTTEMIAVMHGVPVRFDGSGGARTTYPIEAGDNVWLIFASTDIHRYNANGGEVDPASDRRHHLSDAYALLGARGGRNAWKNVPTDRMSLGYDTGATIEIRDDEVRLGGDDADDPVIRKSDLDAFVAAVTAWVPAPTDGGLALKNALLAFWGTGPVFTWPTGSSVVKSK